MVCVAIATTALTGCGGGSSSGTKAGAGSPSAASAPTAFKLDESASVPLPISEQGGGVAVSLGEATAAVSVPAGAAAAGSQWTVTALSEAPAGVKKPLSTGIYVDTSKAAPTQPCLVGFLLPGKAPANATIVRIADDGVSTQIIPTQRLVRDGNTMLTAQVDGFSAYTTSEEDKAAIDKAFTDRAKQRGKEVDFTIKVSGTETQKVEGWTFEYELDMFASGGGMQMGGIYNGHASLSIDGKYKGPASIVKSFGTVSGIGRDQSLRFIIVDEPLASLLTGEPVGDPIVAGAGSMKLKGMASLDIQATAPNVKGRYNKKNVKGDDAVPFLIRITGDDVQVEIPNVGIFPGKILRTTK